MKFKLNHFAILLFLAAAFLLIRLTAGVNAAPGPVKLRIERQHIGKNCTSGQISLEGSIVGYTLERPWQGNIPLISSIPPGRYNGHVRKNTNDRWRIELTDVPGRTNVQLHVGNFVADGLGCVLIGANLSQDLCALTDSKKTFDKFKLAFAAAAAKNGQLDDETPVELTIADLNETK
jgi:Family of unknown function (DUF5675)